jgi:hypothetical protein
MQDGAKGTNGGMYLCTDNFTITDVARLAAFLQSESGLKVSTPKAPGLKGTHRIYV